MKSSIKFPKDFLWGTATSAHQVEGDNKDSDFWYWEKKHKSYENSGIACDHWHKFEDDFRLAKDILHNNAVRLSVEWAKIEPQEGQYNSVALAHYKTVLQTARKLGLKTFVTLHHFTNPLWFMKKGGFEKKANIAAFVKYAAVVATFLGEDIDVLLTFNEPNVYMLNAYMLGYWSPGKRNFFTAVKVYKNMARAHMRAFQVIKRLTSHTQVAPVIQVIFFKASTPRYRQIKRVLDYFVNHSFLKLIKGNFDAIGINYYALHIVSSSSLDLQRPTPATTLKIIHGDVKELGWPIYPAGIYDVVKAFYKKYKKPIYITENGVADAKDKVRGRLIVDTLTWLAQATNEGVDVRGYFHWTLMDNFEWHLGRKAKFGLFETNFKTQKRTPRESAFVYAKIAKENAV